MLNHLPRWRVVAVAPRHIPGLSACDAAFRRLVAHVQQPRSNEEIDALNRYFTTRDRGERKDLNKVTMEDIHQFHAVRQRFGTPEFETLFQRWKAEGLSSLSAPRVPGFVTALREQRGGFVTYQLPIRYDRFGTHAGVV